MSYMTTYLFINFVSLLGPLAYSFEKKLGFYKQWKYLFPAIFITSVFFLYWDYIFVKNFVWGFSPEYTVGLHVFGLPLEEVLFFYCIPYSCVFIYECVLRKQKKVHNNWATWPVMIVVILSLIIMGLTSLNLHYTKVVCFATAGFLILHLAFYKLTILRTFHKAFLIILIPFLIVNSILTFHTPYFDPIVWYNNKFNLALRFFTIPVEDFIYCYLLILMNVTFFEAFRRK